MLPIQLGQITDSDIYLDDNRLVGRVKEFKIGEVAYKMVTHESLGQIGILELPSRAVEALKASLELQYPDIELDARLKNPVKECRFTLHSWLDIFTSGGLNEEKSGRLLTTITTLPAKKGEMSNKLGEAASTSYDLSITAMVVKMSTQSEPLFEYDVMNGIHRVNGADVWPR